METATERTSKVNWAYRSVMEQKQDSTAARLAQFEREFNGLIKELKNGHGSPSLRLKEVEKRIEAMERTINGDPSLGVQPLRVEVQAASAKIDQIDEYVNRAKWLVTLVGGIGGLQAIDLLRSIFQ